MPNDFLDEEKKTASEVHPIFKLILGGVAVVALLLLLKVLKA
jgi:hypothetical protein